MAAPTSFKSILTKWCEKIQPKRILEWGPGVSTEMMEKLCPHAFIFSFEHQKQYYDHWSNRLKSTLFLVEDLNTYANGGNIIWEEKFDMIFVDGRNRVSCLRKALDLVKDDGVVILHDAEREEYRQGIELFTTVDVDDDQGTVVLKKPVG